MLALVTPHRFADLEPERTALGALGATVTEARDAEEVRRLAPQAEVLLVTSLPVDDGLVQRLGKCRAIIRYGAGVDSVDVDAATRAGIPVGNVPDASVEDVAEHALALALACLRALPSAGASMERGEWGTEPVRGVHRLSALRAGVLGLGRIGRAVASRLGMLGMTVSGHDPYVTESPIPLLGLDELLGGSHLVSIHLPLTGETRGLLSRERLEQLPRGAVVVNVARGGLVDESALADLVASGQLGGAGLDVFEREPLDEESPLRSVEGIILSPHVAWYSKEAVRELQHKVAVQATRALRGERLQPTVNPDAYEVPAGHG